MPIDEGTAVAEPIAGRSYGEVYHVRRRDLHQFVLQSIRASGGRILYATDETTAPMFVGVQLDSDERLGLLIYPFRVTRNCIRNRPTDEMRGQIRYGSEPSWARDHPVGRDVAGVDVTLVLGVDPAGGIIIGLDALLWDPLPMGISFYAKISELEAARAASWHVWEKENKPGSKRGVPRSPTGLETVVAFTPERLLDYAKLERRATSLRLDPPLRYSAAKSLADISSSGASPNKHTLEEQFQLSSDEILDLIVDRNRLTVAVRGGVAERHLEAQLRRSPDVVAVKQIDADGMHDFDVELIDGRLFRVECKNASPKKTAGGLCRVEVQKTRSSKGDPASRYYPVNGFDVVAACLFSPTGQWEFRFCRTADMEVHEKHPGRLATMHVIDDSWKGAISAL